MRFETLLNHLATDGYYLSGKEIESIESFVSSNQIDGYLIVPKQSILKTPRKDPRAFCVQNGKPVSPTKIDFHQFWFGIYDAFNGLILVFPKEH